MKKNESNKMLLVIGIVVVLVLGIFLLITFMNKNISESSKLDSNYIAIFGGGNSQITYQTYIYKIDNNEDNYGYKYVNTTSTADSWGSSYWNEKITSEGVVSFKDDVFVIAKKNSAYDYVLYEDKTYNIQEFMEIFLGEEE